MKILLKRIKKTGIIISGIILVLMVAVFFLVSRIGKYTVEKYDVKYSGREIKLDEVYINLFTGYIHFSGVKIYEAGSDSVFFSADEINANVEIHKLFRRTLELSEVTLIHPKGIISQNKSAFNVDDLIKRIKNKDTGIKKNAEPFHVNILNIKIKGGTVCYYERSIPVAYSLKQINIESAGKRWDRDTIEAKFSWLSGIGSGTMKGSIMMDVKSLDYAFSVLASKFDLSIMEQYLKDISDNGSLRCNFDANLKAFGNFSNPENIDATGPLTFNDFHFGKSKTEDYASFKKLTIAVKELSPKNKKYSFDSLALTEPYFKYEKYDHLDNLQNIFGKKGEKIAAVNAKPVNPNFLFQIADYVKAVAKNFFKSNYRINKIAVYKAEIRYVDYTLTEKFEASATPLYIFADSIEHGDEWVNLSLKTEVKPYGKMSVDLSINPKDSSDFKVRYNLRQLPVAMFNPYLITHTSYPLTKGTLELNGNWDVNNGIISSNNHLLVIDPRIGKREKKVGYRWIPLKLIMFFAREKDNVIDYEIPITGNLKKPKFEFSDVIVHALTNLVTKPATSPYRTRVKNMENEIEESFSFNWERQKATLESHQQKFVKELADYLKEFPDKKLNITSILYHEKEKEYILFFEAKKLYYAALQKLKIKALTKDDTLAIDRISIRDSLFMHYLSARAGKASGLTIQDKCTALVGDNRVNNLFNSLINERRKAFMAYFDGDKIAGRINFKNAGMKIPYNGLSFYKIEYEGEWPEKLRSAYMRMSRLNSERPRSEFRLRREKQNQ
ncbi:MAG: DUF748 domain-containing protein [Bacteroidetes bacterium]|nr:DUF748 domain-containing protein [Bacteroidota bacterium]